MIDKPIDLDRHRGMAAQKAIDLRRLRLRQDELEAHLLAAPAANWGEAAEKARYLLNCLPLRQHRRIRAGKSSLRLCSPISRGYLADHKMHRCDPDAVQGP